MKQALMTSISAVVLALEKHCYKPMCIVWSASTTVALVAGQL